MLTWHNTWMASHGRELAREVRAVGTAVAAGDRPLTALAVVVGVAVLREGSEVVLFLYGIFAAGGTSIGDMVGGGAFGIVLGAALSALIYLGLLAVPAHRLFAVTTGLITLLAAGLAAQAVFFLQQANYFQGMATPLWDTSWLLGEDSITGRLLHTLVGYTATPDGAQLIAYALVILMMLALMRVARGRTAAAPPAGAIVSLTANAVLYGVRGGARHAECARRGAAADRNADDHRDSGGRSGRARRRARAHPRRQPVPHRS